MILYYRVKLLIPMAFSLKDKRRVIRSLLEKLKNRFNISAAETGDKDLWKNTTIEIAAVSNDSVYLEKQLDKIEKFIEEFNGVRIIKSNIKYY